MFFNLAGKLFRVIHSCDCSTCTCTCNDMVGFNNWSFIDSNLECDIEIKFGLIMLHGLIMFWEDTCKANFTYILHL